MMTMEWIDVGFDSQQLATLVDDVSEAHRVAARSLLVEGLLYLPRLCGTELRLSLSDAKDELVRVANHLRTRTQPYRELLRPPMQAITHPQQLTFDTASEAEARIILERFHYLASHRPDSEHHVLRAPDGRIAALATMSSMDLPTIASAMDGVADADQMSVISRVFAFDWVPRNTISVLLSQVERAARREHPGLRLLITYLNPNLGFTGASYRASNWLLIGEERGTRYAYIDAVYVTDRELRRRWGTADPTSLVATLGERFSFTSVPLSPLQLFAFPLDSRVRTALVDRRLKVPRP